MILLKLITTLAAVLIILLCSIPQQFVIGNTLLDLIHEKERTIEDLASVVENAYGRSCYLNCSSCVLSACGSLHPNEQYCTTDFGGIRSNNGSCNYDCLKRHLRRNTSNILTSGPEETQEMNVEKCWTLELDKTFQNNYNSQANLTWQYIGTPSGLTRLYPAHVQRHCYSLDPRIRPWYVSATSGPKTVILVLDVSASMLNYGRLQLAKEAAITVVNTLTNADSVGIVLFSDKAKQLLLHTQPSGQLVKATYANLTALQKELQNLVIDPFGGTNFEAAFNQAFDILDVAEIECNSAILFLTDGYPNKGITSEYLLTSLVHTRNHKSTIIFAYTLGSIAGASLLRGIACESQGVYSHIEDGGNLRHQLSQYYDYFALLRVSGSKNVTWVEPYVDAAGAGWLVTVSKAVYDLSLRPPHLIGVVGVDILVSDLLEAGRKAGLDFNHVIEQLASRNECPVVKADSSCSLNQVRVKGGAASCESMISSNCDGLLSSTNCTFNTFPDYCDYETDRYRNNDYLFLRESCCMNTSDDKQCTSKAPNVFHPSMIVITSASFLMTLQCF